MGVFSEIKIAIFKVMVAIAVEQSNLHRRLALKALLTIGTSPRRLMLGFMLPTAFLSMWISNTATTVIINIYLINVEGFQAFLTNF